MELRTIERLLFFLLSICSAPLQIPRPSFPILALGCVIVRSYKRGLHLGWSSNKDRDVRSIVLTVLINKKNDIEKKFKTLKLKIFLCVKE